MSGPVWSVVVPTVGRDSLQALLRSLAAQPDRPADVVVVDDRRPAGGDGTRGAGGARGAEGSVPPPPLDLSACPGARALPGGGLGPAHARNVGWRDVRTEWVVFVDDDVVLPDGWSAGLLRDLAALPERVGGSQARLAVPAPEGRAPTDEERATLGLVGADWVTAEMAYRRRALLAVGGFDERFPRAFREDADLALRVQQEGFPLRLGRRTVVHPLRPTRFASSLARQRGNADDALMRAAHGPAWRRLARCPRGRLATHAVTAGAAAGAVALLLSGRPALRPWAARAGLLWAGLTGQLLWRRTARGPRTARELLDMGLTTPLLPFLALWHRAVGTLRHHRATAWTPEHAAGAPLPATPVTGVPTVPTVPPPVRAVLFDRDGTLVHDVPYNGDPEQVRPVDGAREAVERARAAGLAVGVVTNQSGVARGLLTGDQVAAVNARVEELLGPFDTWQVCPHGPDDACRCRKPAPGMVTAAADALGVPVGSVAVVGDIGADVEAAAAAGAVGVLVPTDVTRTEEVRAARLTARDLGEAVDLLLAGTP